MLIKNYKSIADTKQKQDLLKIIEHAVLQSTPQYILKNSLKRIKNDIFVNNRKVADLKKNRIFVIGAGKASGIMAENFEKVIGAKNITAGRVNYKGYQPQTKKIQTMLAGHPLPNKNSVKGTKQILNLKKDFKINKEDVIFCLISGGGSSLLENPIDGISLQDIQKTTKALLYSGATINEINVVRKKLSRVKGGNLARHFHPARIYSLIISDGIGNDLKTIASGPTVNIPQEKSAYSIIRKYKLENQIAQKVISKLRHSDKNKKTFPKTKNIIISDVNNMVEFAVIKCKELGYDPIILNKKVTGETKNQAEKYAKKIINFVTKQKRRNKQKQAFIFSGETTVAIKNKNGKGGRNQELSLAFLKKMENFKQDWTFVSCASDGVDFLDGVAGGIVDNKTLKLAEENNLDANKYLENHNSYNFLKKVNGLISMGRGTGTNVCDIQICII